MPNHEKALCLVLNVSVRSLADCLNRMQFLKKTKIYPKCLTYLNQNTLFPRYVIRILPFLLVSFSDPVSAVREAAECAARAMMSQLTVHGVKLILPSLLQVLCLNPLSYESRF